MSKQKKREKRTKPLIEKVDPSKAMLTKDPTPPLELMSPRGITPPLGITPPQGIEKNSIAVVESILNGAMSSVGVDVHRDILFVCYHRLYQDENGEWKLLIEEANFKTTGAQLRSFAEWIAVRCPDVVLMESTGIYWHAPFDALEDHGILAKIVNPRSVKGMVGKKTDRADAQWLATIARLGTFIPSFVPEHRWRVLKNVSHQLVGYVHQRQQCKNRLIKHLDSCGYRLTAVFSDVLGAAGRFALNGVLEGTPAEQLADAILSTQSKRLKAKRDELVSALSGRMYQSSIFGAKLLLQTIDFLGEQITTLQASIVKEVMELVPEKFNHLLTLPGVQNLSAAMLLVETGGGAMEFFKSSKHFASWVGMCPGNHESAGKRMSGRIRKGNRYIRSIICECAQGAARTKNSAFSLYFCRMKKRNASYKKSIVALCHKMLRVMYAMLKNGQDYVEPEVKSNEDRILKRLLRAVALLKKQDIDTTAIELQIEKRKESFRRQEENSQKEPDKAA